MDITKFGFKKPKPKSLKKLKKYLIKNEEVLYFSGISQRYYIIQIIIWLPFAFVLLGLPKLLGVLRKNREISYAITNRRFIIIEGIFSKKITSAPINRVTHVTVEQSFFERFLYNSGDLDIVTAGYDKHAIVMEKVANPIKLKVLFEELSDMDLSKKSHKQSKENYELTPKIRKLRPR